MDTKEFELNIDMDNDNIITNNNKYYLIGVTCINHILLSKFYCYDKFKDLNYFSNFLLNNQIIVTKITNPQLCSISDINDLIKNCNEILKIISNMSKKYEFFITFL